MDDPSLLSYSLKFLGCHRQMKHWNQDMLQRGRFLPLNYEQ